MDVSAVAAVGPRDQYSVCLSPMAQSVAMAAAFAGTNPAVVSHAPALAHALQNTVPDDERVGGVGSIGTEVDRYV